MEAERTVAFEALVRHQLLVGVVGVSPRLDRAFGLPGPVLLRDATGPSQCVVAVHPETLRRRQIWNHFDLVVLIHWMYLRMWLDRNQSEWALSPLAALVPWLAVRTVPSGLRLSSFPNTT